MGGKGARCEHPEVVGPQEPGQKRLEARGWGPAAALVCWELVGSRSGPGVVGPSRPGWHEGPRSGCAAGAESAGSAAGGPSSQRTLAAPCGRTDGLPAAVDAGTPTTHRQKRTFLYCTYVDYFLTILHVPESLTHSLSLSVHDGFQFFKVSQFDLQLLHLGLHQQSHK